MQRAIKLISLPLVVCTALAFTGCERSKEAQKPSADVSQDDQIMRELASEPVKPFAKTANDVQDIQALTDFDTRFTAVSDEMEDELMRMKDQGSLTPEFALSRKRDNINSALTMLKALDLKTEQGRYIQGLMYQYWDNQGKLLQQANQQKDQNVSENVKGLGQFIHAQEQLEHWQQQYPSIASPAEKL
ncbi:MAG: hypothetical protein ACN6NX_06640 [Acinetobacter sp.]